MGLSFVWDCIGLTISLFSRSLYYEGISPGKALGLAWKDRGTLNKKLA